MVPFWWYKMVNDNNYVKARFTRWAQWRDSNLQYDRLMATIDSLANVVTCCGAEQRNSQAWPRWGVWVWPNRYVSKSYDDEINYLKEWITKRITWMDGLLRYTPPEPPEPPEPGYATGDVNGDGEVNIGDVTTLIDCILQGGSDDESLWERADVDQDGEVGIADVTSLISIILQHPANT